MSSHVALRRVASCRVISRHVALCRIMSRHVTSCHVTSCHHATWCTLCHVMARHVMSYHVMSRHVTSRHVTSCHHARWCTSCHVMSRHVTSCHIFPRHVTSCHIMLRHITSKVADGHATNASLSTDFFHTQSIQIKHDRVRWLSRRLPIQYRISGIWSSYRQPCVATRRLCFTSVYFYLFLFFFYSTLVLRNYRTDSHQIFRNCVFWCSLNNPVVFKFFWRHLAEKNAKNSKNLVKISRVDSDFWQ